MSSFQDLTVNSIADFMPVVSVKECSNLHSLNVSSTNMFVEYAGWSSLSGKRGV